METLERPMIASIEKIEINSAKLKKLAAEVEEQLGTPPATPPASFPWAMLALGAGLGAAVVAIATSFF